MHSARGAKVLIICQEFDPHVDHMIVLLARCGIGSVRWPTNLFPMRSSLSLLAAAGSQGSLTIDGARVGLDEIRSVWYRHPAPFGVSRRLSAGEKRFAHEELQAAFSGLSHVLDCLWVNHPDRVRTASSKVLQLRVARELGFETPKTLVSNDPAEIRRFFDECGGALVYKAFRSGFFAMSDKVCLTTPLAQAHLARLDLIRSAPGIFQERIAKRFDLRITVIGRRVFAAEIHSQACDRSRADWRGAAVQELDHRPHVLPAPIEELCLRLVDHFGLVFGAIDMVLTPDGRYVFLENNPSGQFGWVEGRTGVPLTAVLAEMLVAGRVPCAR